MNDMERTVKAAIRFLEERGFTIIPPDTALNAKDVVSALKANPERDIYQSAELQFHISYPQGLHKYIPAEVVETLLTQQVIKLKWPDKPNIKCYVLNE